MTDDHTTPMKIVSACRTLSLLCPLLAAHPARADPPPPTEPVSPIRYTAAIPPQVTRYRPRRAIVRFYGVTAIHNQKVALLFCDLQPLRKVDQDLVRRRCRIDIFTVGSSHGGASYGHINTIIAIDERWPEGRLTFDMGLMWLDPVGKTIPILRLSRTNLTRYFGSDGRDILFVFPRGFANAPVTSGFGRSYPAEALSSSDIQYGPVDRAGNLTVLQLHNDRGTMQYTAYKWNGHALTRAATASDYLGGPVRQHWNGESFVEEDQSKRLPE